MGDEGGDGGFIVFWKIDEGGVFVCWEDKVDVVEDWLFGVGGVGKGDVFELYVVGGGFNW